MRLAEVGAFCCGCPRCASQTDKGVTEDPPAINRLWDKMQMIGGASPPARASGTSSSTF